MPFNLDAIKARPPGSSGCLRTISRAGIHVYLIKEYADAAVQRPASAEVARNYRVVQTKSDLDNLVRTLFDAESVGVASG